jgi:phosphoribosylformylglycinamidine synthase
MKKKIGILRFPGSNCDRDVQFFVEAKGFDPVFLPSSDLFLVHEYESLILPGGFSFGDYLRSGALAARSKAMQSVREFADKGGPVLGICNGFQILTEAQLLPGALMKNLSGRFQDEWVELAVVESAQYWGPKLSKGSQRLRLPIAHGDGRYYNTEEELKKIWDSGQVWLTYQGQNPNGSLGNIAGVLNAKKNVAALMPHPERAIFDWMDGIDGWGFL